MTLAEYAEQWGRDLEHNFAVTCYERYTVRELEQILARAHAPNADDRQDMRTWGLTPEEWNEALSAAWLTKRAE